MKFLPLKSKRDWRTILLSATIVIIVTAYIGWQISTMDISASLNSTCMDCGPTVSWSSVLVVIVVALLVGLIIAPFTSYTTSTEDEKK